MDQEEFQEWEEETLVEKQEICKTVAIGKINERSPKNGNMTGHEGKDVLTGVEKVPSTDTVNSWKSKSDIVCKSRERSLTKKGNKNVPIDDISLIESYGQLIGDIGYKFKKLFNEGQFSGIVADIIHDLGRKSRHCIYSDGDSEYLSLQELEQLFQYEKLTIVDNKKKIEYLLQKIKEKEVSSKTPKKTK